MDFSRIQDFDMQLLHVFNGSENVWLDQMAMALTSGWTWIPLYIVLFVVVIRNNEMMGRLHSWLEERCSVSFWLMDWWMESSNRWLKDSRPSSDPMFKYTVQVVDNMRLKSFSLCSAHAANTLSIAIFFSLLIRSKAGYVDPGIMVARKLLDPSLPGCSLSGRHSLRFGYWCCGGSCRLSYLHRDVLPHLPKD